MIRPALSVAAALVALVAATQTQAQEALTAPEGRIEAVTPSPSPEPAAPPSLVPNGPNAAAACESPDKVAVERDWIRLSSGEWLSGSIERIRDETVYFDSEELDDLEIDFADVVELRSTQQHTFRFGRRDIQTGVANLANGDLTIVTSSGTIARPKKDLVTMIQGVPKESNFWSVDASVGMTVREGNTEQIDIGARVDIMRETALTRWTNLYNGNYNETDSTIQANSHRASTAFDVFLTRKLYLVVPVIEYYTDEIQNIEARITPAAGVGYDILDMRRADLEVSVAAGYQYLVNGPAMPGDTRQRSSDATVLFTVNLDLDPTSNLEWDTDYQNTLVVTDLGQTSHHLMSVLSFDLWGPIDFDTTFVWDRIEEPALNDDGTQPASDDLRITVGLGIDF